MHRFHSMSQLILVDFTNIVNQGKQSPLVIGHGSGKTARIMQDPDRFLSLLLLLTFWLLTSCHLLTFLLIDVNR
jgi:hypothetical protein